MKGRRESHDRLQMSVVIIFFYCPACLLLTGFTHSHSKMIHEESWRHRALVSVSCKQKATGQPCLSFWWSCLSPKIVECSCKMALQSSPLATSGLAKIRTLAKQHCLQFSFKKALPSKLLQKTVLRQSVPRQAMKSGQQPWGPPWSLSLPPWMRGCFFDTQSATESKTTWEQLGCIELTITSHTASCFTYFLRCAQNQRSWNFSCLKPIQSQAPFSHNQFCQENRTFDTKRGPLLLP